MRCSGMILLYIKDQIKLITHSLNISVHTGCLKCGSCNKKEVRQIGRLWLSDVALQAVP